MKNLFIFALSFLFLSFFFAIGARAAEPGVYTDIIAPLMEAKCVKCHGEEKRKGKLRLDTHAFILQGADEEAILVAGKPGEGSFFERIRLPLDDDDHMPPEDEEQLTEGEIKLLEWWVKEGAKADLTVAAATKPKDLEPVIEEFLKNKPKGKEVAAAEKGPSEAEKAATAAKAKLAAEVMAKVNTTGATLMPLSAENDDELRFTALNVAKEFADAQLAALAPVAGQILWLDLAGTKVTDAGLAQVAAMKSLKRLYLQNTGITDAGLDHLAGLGELEYLNLYGSKISDAGLAKLGGLKKLKTIYVWQTKATEAGAAALEKKIPGLDANIGWAEKEKPVVAAAATPSAAPKPPAPPAAAPPAAPKPEATPAVQPPAKPAAPPAENKPAPTPVAKPPVPDVAKAVAEAKVAVEKAKKRAEEAEKAHLEARKALDALEAKLQALEKAAAGK